MVNSVINFHHVSKQYVKQRLRYGMLSETIGRLFINDHSGKAGSRSAGQQSTINHNVIKALDNVSFDINKGEALGIIGPNGAGKSTILKLISKVTVPDSGQVTANGKIGALIELGAGLHPELTGRENIFLYGAILGMKKQEVEAKFEDIVAFAEIKELLDMPIKRYSSGMYARLGFAVAVQMEPDILLIDEVLAVGDESFQKKCFAKMKQAKNKGITVVFVSHNLDWIKLICDRVLLIQHGKIIADRSPWRAISAYHSISS
ncbi:ABC transporter ATP-binding protein [Candidatus Collierbacteria bacterium]|nr:ABC transporter ATP-binding protein [Candidatus Collierbacteria bacterium]